MHDLWEGKSVQPTMESSLGFPQIIEDSITMKASNSTTGYLPPPKKTLNLKRYMPPVFIADVVTIAKI